MAEISTSKLHELADAAAGQGDFLTALRYVSEALRGAPQDHRARLKVGLCFAALGETGHALSTFRVGALSLARHGFVLSAMGVCRDALGISPGAPDILAALRQIHEPIAGLEGRGRARVPPPSVPVDVRDDDEGSFIRLTEQRALIDAAIAQALRDPSDDSEPMAPAAIPLFSDLSTAAFVPLMETIRYLKVPPGYTVLKEHDESSSLFILLHGEVSVQRDGEQELARLGPGSLFGELALITSKPRSATVVTTHPSELFEIERAAVEQLAASNPSVAQDLAKFARRRLIMNLMAHSKIFAPFEDQQRLEILKTFVSKVVAPGEVLIAEGRESTGLFLVLEGQVEVSKGDESGDQVVLSYLGQGEVFGEIALIEARPTTARVVASEKSVVLYLEKAKFDRFVEQHPKILEYLSTLSQERLEETEEAMASDGVILEADDLIIL